MSLAAGTPLTPHFSAHELGADNPEIPGAALANLYKVAAWLEAFRNAVGAPVTVASGWRSPTHNAEVGGSKTSDHVTGLAADFTTRGTSQYGAYKLIKAGKLPPFDQVIFYPVDGHIHVGLGPKMRGELRLALAEGGYPILSPDLVAQLKGATPVLLVIAGVVLLLLAAARKGGA